ncbi:surface protease GP63, partial [Trypanosoma conorhini]
VNYFGSPVTCTAEPILTEHKRQLYTKKIIPEAVKLHAERLLVRPVTENIVVPINPKGHCRHFTIPTGAHERGVVWRVPTLSPTPLPGHSVITFQRGRPSALRGVTFALPSAP